MIVVLVTIVVFGLVFALVTWRRRVTARWQPDLTRHVVESDGPWCTNVWLQKEPPRRSRRGGNDRVKGEVCVDVTANPDALAFYESVGFVAVGEAETRFGPAPRMRLEIREAEPDRS